MSNLIPLSTDEEMRPVQVNDLAAALSKAQAEIKHATKDSANPFFKSSYADLASVWDACKGPLTKYGLSVTQTTDILDNGQAILITTLLHSSGQYIRGRYPLTPVKNDPQAMGSAVTYARRYTLQAIVGIAPDDDDGEAAMQRGKKAEQIHTQVTAPSPQSKPTAKTKFSSAEYVIPFGRDAGKKIGEFNPDAIQKSIDYWRGKEREDGSLSGKAKEYVEAMEDYLKTL